LEIVDKIKADIRHRQLSEKPWAVNDFMVSINQLVQQAIGYGVRLEPGIQTCEETLTLAKGSCRDSAWLLVQIFRHLGYAARFASGYLVQLTADVKALDGPSGPEKDFTDLHAWTEIYIPGAGWIGLDPTSGLLATEGHIPLACTPDPISAAPITGATGKCEVEFSYSNEVFRILEDPRVTKPYTEDQWQTINALGAAVDKELLEQDVRLTTGGEPTFVSIDDMESEQWNTGALGADKLRLAKDLLLRMRNTLRQTVYCITVRANGTRVKKYRAGHSVVSGAPTAKPSGPIPIYWRAPIKITASPMWMLKNSRNCCAKKFTSIATI